MQTLLILIRLAALRDFSGYAIFSKVSYMYMYICFEGLREDWLSQLSYPHKIKKLLTSLTCLYKTSCIHGLLTWIDLRCKIGKELDVYQSFTCNLGQVMRKCVLCHMQTTKCRSVCASAQSDQHLCCSLLR